MSRISFITLTKPSHCRVILHQHNLPDWLCTMSSLLQSHRLLPLICALLSCSPPRPGHAWPRVAQDGAPDAGRAGRAGGAAGRNADEARLLLLESVKAGILSTLGTAREPRPAVKASDEELRRVYGLYVETLRLLKENLTEPKREVRSVEKRRFTVLFPETGEMHVVFFVMLLSGDKIAI